MEIVTPKLETCWSQNKTKTKKKKNHFSWCFANCCVYYCIGKSRKTNKYNNNKKKKNLWIYTSQKQTISNWIFCVQKLLQHCILSYFESIYGMLTKNMQRLWHKSLNVNLNVKTKQNQAFQHIRVQLQKQCWQFGSKSFSSHTIKMALPVFCLLQASLATPVCVSPPPFILHSLHILHIQHFCFTIFKEFAVFVLSLYKDFTSRLSCQMAVGMESVSSGVFL